MTPTSAVVGDTVTLTLKGTGFVSGSKVRWSGTDVATVFVSDTMLTAKLDSTRTSSAGLAVVTVVSPAPGGGESGGTAFRVYPVLTPVLLSLNPPMSLVNASGVTLQVIGAQFQSGARITFNGTALTTTVVDSAHLTATVPAASLASTGSATITVVQHGRTSGAYPFAIVSGTSGHPHAWTLTSLPLGNGPWGVAISSAGDAFVGRPLTDSIARIDLATPAITGSFRVGNRPDDIAFYGTGTAYVTNIDDNAVGVVNVASHVQSSAYPLTQPIRVRVSSDGSALYVSSTDDSLHVLNASNGAAIKQLGLNGIGNGMAMSPDGSMLWVSTTGGTVYGIATSTNTVSRTITVGGTLQDVAISPDGGTLYVASESGGSVGVYSTSTGALIDSTAVPAAFGLAVTPDGSELWVTQATSGLVTVLDAGSRQVLGRVNTGGTPRHLGFSADGSTVLIANEYGYAQVVK